MANRGDMMSTSSCHFGGFFGFFGRPICRRCRIAIRTRKVPMAIFTASDASDGTVFGLGGLLPVASIVTVTTMASETSQQECRALSHAAPGGQHDDECGQRQRVECYRQANHNKIHNHSGPST
jgi:hypothetical protein